MKIKIKIKKSVKSVVCAHGVQCNETGHALIFAFYKNEDQLCSCSCQKAVQKEREESWE